MVNGYDVTQFNAVLKEHLHQAATEGLADNDIAAILRQHAEGIENDGLEAHAGFSTIPFEDLLDRTNADCDVGHRADSD